MWMVGRSSPRVATSKRIACFSGGKNRYNKICFKLTNGNGCKRSSSQRRAGDSKRSTFKTRQQRTVLSIGIGSTSGTTHNTGTSRKKSGIGRSSAVDHHPIRRRESTNNSCRAVTADASVIKENHGKVKSNSGSSGKLNQNFTLNFVKNTNSNKYAMVDRESLTSKQTLTSSLQLSGAVGSSNSSERSSSLLPTTSSTNANVYITDDNQNSTVHPATKTAPIDRNANTSIAAAAASTSRLTNDPSVVSPPSSNQVSNSSALCDIVENNNNNNDNSLALACSPSPVDNLQSTLAIEQSDELSTSSSVSKKKSSKKSKKDKSEEGSTKKSKSSEHKKKRSKVASTDYCKIERPEAEGAEENSVIDFDNDPEAAEWAKLRCTSDSTEVVAEREARRQRRRCADYPGLAFGGSIFGTDTMMKFNIIRNELHNIMKTQLKRVKFFHIPFHAN